jgi:hypothetical protein
MLVELKNGLIMIYIIINKVIQRKYLNVYLNQKQKLKKIKQNNNNHHHHHQQEHMEYGNNYIFN